MTVTKLGKLGDLNLFGLVAETLKVIALGAVLVTVAPNAGELLGLSGVAGWIGGGLVAVFLDAIWLGAMTSVDRAIKARTWGVVALMASLSGAAAGGSTALMAHLGHGGVLAFLPAAALVVTATRIVHDNVSVSRETAEDLARARDAETNTRAVSRSNARLAEKRRRREAAEEVAGLAAESDRELALAEEAVRQRIAQAARYADLNRQIRESEKEHGDAERTFREWFASVSLAARMAPVILGPVEPVRLPGGRHGDAEDPFNLRELEAASGDPLSTWTSQVSAATASVRGAVHADVDAPGVRLDATAARAAIEAAWEAGLTVREAAVRATRSVSYVGGVYAQLTKSRGGQPLKGRMRIGGDAA